VEAVRLLDAARNVRVATSPRALVRALRVLDVDPDLQQGRAARLVPMHRRTPTGDVWFL
jgi:hypothetical protein